MTSVEQPTRPGTPWLVVVDMQVIFGDAASDWCTPDFDAITPGILRLIAEFGDDVVYTRFIAAEHPVGAWVPYYELWPFALDAGAWNNLAPAFDAGGHAVIDRPTFGKWSSELEAAIGGSSEVVLVGVSTDCCVLSTAIGAADAGVHVRVAADACAGLSEADHRRALDAMALYAPLIEITTVAEVVGERTIHAYSSTTGSDDMDDDG